MLIVVKTLVLALIVAGALSAAVVGYGIGDEDVRDDR